jgi:hypothetical protein
MTSDDPPRKLDSICDAEVLALDAARNENSWREGGWGRDTGVVSALALKQSRPRSGVSLESSLRLELNKEALQRTK